MNRASDTLLRLLNRALVIGIAILLALSGNACTPGSPESSTPTVADALGNPNGDNLEGFLWAIKHREFTFPQDHNVHPGYRNEWWYFTGNLQSDEGQHYGYQVTFFRVALTPENKQTLEERSSRWAANVVWMAHAAITDIDNEIHLHDERFAREAAGLAGNQPAPFRVWLEDWQILSTTNDFPWQISLKASGFSIDLQLIPQKPILLQGESGLSQKSKDPGNASYYYSMPRLSTQGVVYIADEAIPVHGISWLDREWSTSALGRDQRGWDWFSLQLEDNTELMFYQLRKKDGSIDSFSKGVFRSAKGVTKLKPDNTQLTPLDYWRSHTGRRYPIRWQLKSQALNKDWIVEAAVDDQLMETFIEYWEGAVQVVDAESNRVVGVGYLEMTGY